MLLAGGLVVAGGSPASAACPAGDGTIPGSGSTVTPVGTGDGTQYTTIYVDDRDFADADGDGVSGGLWTYIETNSVAELQRGGDQLIFDFVNPQIPRVDPIVVLPPDASRPVRPEGLTLLPNGLGGGSLAEAAGEHDDCTTAQDGTPWTSTPDKIIF
jgi:hypothetical protein